jgi:hypothetical protein
VQAQVHVVYAETAIAELQEQGLVLGEDADEEQLTPRTVGWGAPPPPRARDPRRG